MFIGLVSQKEKRKPVAPQSEIRNLAGLQLQGKLVSDQGDEFGIRGFSLGIAAETDDPINAELCTLLPSDPRF